MAAESGSFEGIGSADVRNSVIAAKEEVQQAYFSKLEKQEQHEQHGQQLNHQGLGLADFGSEVCAVAKKRSTKPIAIPTAASRQTETDEGRRGLTAVSSQVLVPLAALSGEIGKT
jgi:hypothetical protein